MQTDVAENILDIVRTLPRTKQQRVLDFASELQGEEASALTETLRRIEARGESIPDEVWKEVPADGSSNHDHYLYGAKKRK